MDASRLRLILFVTFLCACKFPPPPDVTSDADEVDEFTVSASATAWVRLNGATSVPVTVQRGHGFDGAINITARGLPPGVSATPLALGVGQDEGTLVLSSDVSAGAVPGALADVTIAGTAGATERTSGPLALLVAGRPGSFDDTFGNEGVALSPDATWLAGDSFMQGMRVVTIVNLGRPALRRFNADGSPDLTFGDGGILVPQFEHLGSRGPILYLEAASDRMGRIYVIGLADGDQSNAVRRDIFVRRYSADGTADVTFNGRQLQFASISITSISAVAITAYDEIYLGGSYRDETRTNGFLTRLDSSGLPDPIFGGFEGVETLLPNGVYNEVPAIAVTAIGTPVVAMRSHSFLGDTSFQVQLLRFDRGGRLDGSFAGHGAVGLNQLTPGVTYGVWIEGLDVAPDGRINAWGHVKLDERVASDAAIWRFTSTGTPDPSFSEDGVWRVGSGNSDRVSALAYDSAVGYLAAGLRTGNTMGMVLYHLRPDGTGVLGFGTEGVLMTNAAFDPNARAHLLIDQRRFVLTGGAASGSGSGGSSGAATGALRVWF